MKIVVVSWRDLANPLAGGSEVVVDRLLLELSRLGHEVALVCGGPVGPRPYPVVEAGGTFTQYILAPFKVSSRFRNWDILIDVENGIPYFSPVWWHKPRVCLVHHVHTDQWRTRFGPVMSLVGKLLESKMMPLAYRKQRFIAISNSTKKALLGLGIKDNAIEVIHSGIDVAKDQIGIDQQIQGHSWQSWRDSKADRPLYVCIGRLVPHKRVELILAAWDRVKEIIDGELWVLGDGPERARLESYAGERVRFMGKVSWEERNSILQQAWLLVHGAHHEGWGLVIIEAASFSTPCLAFDAEGVSEAIVEGQTGILARSQTEFENKWIEIAGNIEGLASLGHEAYLRSLEFTWESTASKFESLLLEICNQTLPNVNQRTKKRA